MTRILLTAAMLSLFAGASQLVATDRPNILLIVSDDQGYNDLGILGNGIITPALDRLAKEGTRLTNFYVTWPACTPSRAGLLTGRYPQRNGIYDMIRNEAPDYRGETKSPRSEMFWKRKDSIGARVGSWKWGDMGGKSGGLFDLDSDVSEEIDLSQQRPDVLKMVKDRYANWLAEMEAAEPRGPFRDF